ncbi:uncharacterized protein LOC130522406 isoform X2 [Takifugu flavidus]|uniref:uncharacterized protein LOC130522406 isoform X2 n=1 Tax=Takifugu flavidus TaxID=433684 RepID=UPI002544ABA9|nr:uncharacterized protein LOC130522406 isoform X2 [Takifugu flavidus]
MNDHSPNQSSSHHHHHHHQLSPCHLTLHNLQGPELAYPSSQLVLDPLEEHGGREEDSATSFLISSPSPGGRRMRTGSDRGLLNTSSTSLNGDANLGGHLDGEIGTSSHFADTYGYRTSKREDIWEDEESFDSATEYLYSTGNGCIKVNDVFHIMNQNSNEGIRQKFRADKTEASISRQTAPFIRSASDGQEYCRTNSNVSDNYVGRDEDYGSSCGSGEDHLQPIEIERTWFSPSPSRGLEETHVRDRTQCSPVSIGSGTQKLDSFSEAFLSQRKGRFPMIPSEDSGRQIWEFGRGGSPRLGGSRQSCTFDPDSYLPPTSSSSPFHYSHASFPSPPTSSSLVSAVLSPPPTPRPPPSFSPPKVDSRATFLGSGQSMSHGGEPLGTLQFFPSYPQTLPSVHTPGMIWELPLMTHSFSQSSTVKVECDGDFSNSKDNLRSTNNDITASQSSKSPDSFLASVLPPSILCASTIACVPPSYHLPSIPTRHNEAAERADPYVVAQRVQTISDERSPAQLQASQIYTGTPFPSILQSGRGQRKGHYTPRPLLNPARRGKGLYFNLSPQHHREAADGGDDGDVLPYVNIGHEFQAELPPYALRGDGPTRWLPDEESPREKLLWKPWLDLEDSANLQDQVEKLLSMCGSSCLPGGGSNTELALHCLHYCQGNTLATLEMLLFSLPSPAGDYHYSGSDFWTDAEKSLFNAALGSYGKEFSLVQKTVRTKTAQQCVEFFYLDKKLHEKQEKQKQENQVGGLEQQTGSTPNCRPMNRPLVLKETVSMPSLATCFPCKLCGKMFFKIKSRNAHMKIHRQPQEDWTDRRLQHQIVAQRPGGNLLPAQVPFRSIPSSCLPGRTCNADIVLNLLSSSNTIAPSNSSVLDPSAMVTSSNNAAPNSHLSTDAAQAEHATVAPFYQSWGSFGPDSAAFCCNTEGKCDMGAGLLGAKEPIKWQ